MFDKICFRCARLCQALNFKPTAVLYIFIIPESDKVKGQEGRSTNLSFFFIHQNIVQSYISI